MGSEENKMSDGTSFQPSEPALCANGCGFFGSAATMNLCSKCFRDVRIQEEQTVSAKAAMEKLVNQKNPPVVVVGPSSSSSSVAVEAAAAEVVSVSESEQLASEAVVASGEPVAQKPTNRCLTCNKKVGVMGFKCRCGSTFCGTHRYPEKHDCEFDFKAVGKDAIAKANPVVKADKINRF